MRLALISIFCFFIGIGCVFGQQPKRPQSPDKIKIVDISAASPVRDGERNEFTVQVEYTLETAEEALVSIGFNTSDPGSFRMGGGKRILKGTSILTMKAVTTPKDWKERGDFIILVNIMPLSSSGTSVRPLAGVRKVIDFTP